MASNFAKAGWDAGAIAVVLGWGANALPTLSLLIPIIYYLVLIWELKTVQDLVKRLMYRQGYKQGVKAAIAKVEEVAPAKVVDKVVTALEKPSEGTKAP